MKRQDKLVMARMIFSAKTLNGAAESAALRALRSSALRRREARKLRNLSLKAEDVPCPNA